MGKSPRHVYLIPQFRRQCHCGPSPLRRRTAAYVYDNIQHFPLDDAAKLSLGFLKLIMQAAKCSFARAGPIVLNEGVFDASFKELFSMVSLHKETSFIDESISFKS